MKTHRMVSKAMLAVLAAALFGAAGGALAAGPFDGVNLRVGTLGGPWTDIQKAMLMPKLEALGAKVTYIAGSPQINLAKLIAARGGPPPVDVIEISDGTLVDITAGGFLHPLDPALIPNTKFLAKGQPDKLMVPIWITEEGICYNEPKYKELGLAPPRTYADLADPKLQGRIQIPDIVSGGGLAAVAGFAYANGGDVNNIKPGLEAISKLKALKFWKTGTEALNQFKSGDIYAAVIHSGWCVRAARAGMPVMSAYPVINAKTVGVLKEGWMGVVNGIDKKTAEAATMYLNLFLDTEFQREFALKLGVVPVNLNALKDLASDPLLAKQLILDPKDIDRMLHVDYSKVNVSDWYDQWEPNGREVDGAGIVFVSIGSR